MGLDCAVCFPTVDQQCSKCSNCGFAAWALSANLTADESRQFDDQIVHCRRIRRDEYVHHAGFALTSLNVINSGFTKTRIVDVNGRMQITGFSMRGEIVGLDAIGTGKHQCDSIALEDTYLCGIAFSRFEQLSRDIPALQRHFHRAMSAEIARDHGIMLLLGSMRADERVAKFLLNLSKRFSARGYSETCFNLPMSRQDIGSYLGLKLETVSRAFSHFNDIEIIAINNKNVEIRSLARLQQETTRLAPSLSSPFPGVAANPPLLSISRLTYATVQNLPA